MKKLLLLLGLLITSLFSASFDCKKAKTDVEKLVCSNEELSKLDDKLQESYSILRTYLTFEEDYTCGKHKEISFGDTYTCEMDKHLRLDDELIETYETFIAKNKNELKKQREWLKQTNLCKDRDCVKQAYETRIDELNKEIKTFSNSLLKAQKEAKESFKKTNSIIEPIHIFDRVNANALIRIKPLFLTDKEYVSILHDYAYYLTVKAGTRIYETDYPLWEFQNKISDTWNFPMGEGIKYIYSDGRRLEEALRALLKAKEINPNDINVSKLLAKTYLKLLIFNRNGVMCKLSRWCINIGLSYKEIPYLMKQAYLDYVKLSKANNIEPELDEIEQTIVNRQRMFYEVLSSFAGDVSLVDYSATTEDHVEDPKFKNICKEYVAMLNKMPDNNLTLCSRYASEKNSLFEFVKYEDAPDEYKKYTLSYPSYTGSPYLKRSRFLVKYKDAYFVDGYIKLGLVFDNKSKYDLLDNDNVCVYTYVDFSLKDQNEIIYQGSCSSIENYDQIYKNGKE
jgi:uncharacterized protein